MKIQTHLLNTLFLAFLCNSFYGQFTKVEEERMFQSNLKSPIEVGAVEQGNKISFIVMNRSYYPYRVKIRFEELRNLGPVISSREGIAFPGRNEIVSFSVIDNEQSVSYQYSFSFIIGIPSKDVIMDFPYLIPIRVNSKFDFVSPPDNPHNYYLDFFRLSKGDTIYTMRKGTIVAIPDSHLEVDRISSGNSIEVLHKDGTIMVYENIDPENVFAKPGKTVFPGQPLGVVDENGILEVRLFLIDENNRLKMLTINYYMDSITKQSFSEKMVNFRISHPEHIIIMEMTKREIKNLNSFNLNKDTPTPP